MKVSRHCRLRDVDGRQWEKLAGQIGVDPAGLLRRIADMAARVPEAAAAARRQPNGEGLDHPVIDRLHDRLAVRAAVCVRTVRDALDAA